MLLSLAAAMVAALCYGVAAVMQAMAVRAASRRTAGAAGSGSSALGRVDPSLVLRMLHQWRFIASLALDLSGSSPSWWRCGGFRCSPSRR